MSDTPDVSQLPQFTGGRARCQPCGWPEAATEYTPPFAGGVQRVLDRRDLDGNRWPSGRFLKRTCTRCGFEWAEACVGDVIEADAARRPGRCLSMNLGDRCERNDMHPGYHCYGGREWAGPQHVAPHPDGSVLFAQCGSMNLGDRCIKPRGHTGTLHRNDSRGWAE